MTQGQLNSGDSLLTALVSGSTAAAISATLTYPLDCIKTQQQLNNEVKMHKFNIPGNYPSTLAQVFRGGSALVIGSIMKNSARLILYNWLTKFMALDSADGTGHHKQKTSAPRIVIAGVMSGLIETMWIIPFENIKIAMIQNMTLNNEIARSAEHGIKYDVTGLSGIAKHHKPPQSVFTRQYVSPHAYMTSDILSQYKLGKLSSRFLPTTRPTKMDSLKLKYNKHPSMTFFSTVREIYTLKGLRGFASGTCITMVRQVAISTAWLSTYNATRQWLDPHSNSNEQSWFGHKHTAFQLVGLHLLSSLAVIVLTQPLDVIKSHLQLKNGKQVYKDSLHTAYKLFMEQGYRSLWRGSLPRGIKIAINGGLTASVYSYVEDIVGVAGAQTIFASD